MVGIWRSIRWLFLRKAVLRVLKKTPKKVGENLAHLWSGHLWSSLEKSTKKSWPGNRPSNLAIWWCDLCSMKRRQTSKKNGSQRNHNDKKFALFPKIGVPPNHPFNRVFQYKQSISLFPKIGGNTPKMDGENIGKPYFLMDDFGGKPLFLETPNCQKFHPLANHWFMLHHFLEDPRKTCFGKIWKISSWAK